MDHRARRPAVGLLEPVFPGVRRIAVLRGGGLGDLMFALPAIMALAATYPAATITLLAMPAHAALLAGRPSPVTEAEVLPVTNGVRPGPDDPVARKAFLARMRDRHFDLAVQMHGGGRNSNPFLLDLGARHTVGPRTSDAVALERTLPYLYYQHEVLRWLEVVALAGALPVDLEPRLELTPEEATAAAAPRERPLVVMHPGATDERRRWPAAGFGEVVAELARQGAEVQVVGDAADADLAAEVVREARRRGADGAAVRSRAGELDLSGLVALLAAGSVVLGNDSGPRHIAQAVGTATVGIYWFGNVLNAGALGRGRHRLEIGWTTACPVCGRDATQVGWTAERCEHEVSFVADVSPAAVLTAVTDLLAGR